MKENRDFCNKAYMTEEQHRNLVADARATRKSVSTLLCDCYEAWRNVKAQRRPIPRPSLVPFQAKFAPGRGARPAAYMRS